MSAIGGILHLNDEPIDPIVLGTFHQALTHRGPDGQATLQQQFVAFTHQRYHSTHLDHDEPIPAQHDHILLTHNARFSNRNQLIHQLGLSEHDGDPPTTGEIIIRAYQKWGLRFVDHCSGEFAIAFWDQRAQQLTLIRDHMGLRGVFYLFQPPYFAFASEIKALKTLPFFDPMPDDLYIGHFLLWQRPPIETTTFTQIKRLPSGYMLQIGRAQSLKTWSYWDLAATSGPRYASDQDYVDGFRELFANVVKNNLDSRYTIGSELSGGLDSSAVAAMLSRQLAQPLPTFSAIMPDVPTSNEEPIIRDIVSAIGADPHYERVDRADLPALLTAAGRCFDDITFAPNYFSVWMLAKAAKEKGIRTLFTGHDGNTMVSDGYSYLNELAIQSEWTSLSAAVDALVDKRGYSDVSFARRSYFLEYIEPVLSHLLRKRQMAAFWRGFQLVQAATNVPSAMLMGRNVLSATLPNRLKAQIMKRIAFRQTRDAPLTPDFQKQMQRTMPYMPPTVFETERAAHIFYLRQAMQGLVGEIRESMGYHFGLEYRHPYTDRALIEYAVNLPSHLKMYDGWSRWILRAATYDVLPDRFRWQRNKTYMSDNFHHLIEVNRDGLWEMVQSASGLGHYLQVNKLKPIPNQRLNITQQQYLWAGAVLSMYL